LTPPLHTPLYASISTKYNLQNSFNSLITCTWTLVSTPFQRNADAMLNVRLSTWFFLSRSIQISRATTNPSNTKVLSERRSINMESGLLNVITITRKSTTSGYMHGLPVTHTVLFTLNVAAIGICCTTTTTTRQESTQRTKKYINLFMFDSANDFLIRCNFGYRVGLHRKVNNVPWLCLMQCQRAKTRTIRPRWHNGIDCINFTFFLCSKNVAIHEVHGVRVSLSSFLFTRESAWYIILVLSDCLSV